MDTKEFKFNKQTVNFEVENKNVLVNATEMAKIFGKECIKFTELINTQELVKKLVEQEKLKSENKEKDNFQTPNLEFVNSENSTSQDGNSRFENGEKFNVSSLIIKFQEENKKDET